MAIDEVNVADPISGSTAVLVVPAEPSDEVSHLPNAGVACAFESHAE